MRNTTPLGFGWTFAPMVVALLGWFLAFPNLAQAQGAKGNNDVYDSSGNQKRSTAFIDASMFANSPPPPLNFGTVLNYVLTHSVPASGAVVDTRGLPFTNPPTSMTCTCTPWSGITAYPSTILLPAGTITIPLLGSCPTAPASSVRAAPIRLTVAARSRTRRFKPRQA